MQNFGMTMKFWEISCLKNMQHVIIFFKKANRVIGIIEPYTINNNPGQKPGKFKDKNVQAVNECYWNVIDYTHLC